MKTLGHVLPTVEFGSSRNDEPLPIDRTGELWRAAMTPGRSITRRSAIRRAVSGTNSAVIEATLLLGRAMAGGHFTGPKAELIRGAYAGFRKKIPYSGFQKKTHGGQNSDQEWMNQSSIRDLRDVILMHYLDRIDQLLAEMREGHAEQVFAPVGQVVDAPEPDTDSNPTYGMF